MNSVIINGNLGKEPEVTMTTTGKKFCKFSIANDKGNKETQWADCRAWDTRAEYLEKYCHTGYRLLVQGRIMFDSYKKDGENKKSTYILCDRIEIERGTDNDARRAMTYQKEERPQKASEWRTEGEIDSEDLPF